MIARLSNKQLRSVGGEIASVFRQLRTVASNGSYGVLWANFDSIRQPMLVRWAISFLNISSPVGYQYQGLGIRGIGQIIDKESLAVLCWNVVVSIVADTTRR